MHIADPEQAETDIQVSLTLLLNLPKSKPSYVALRTATFMPEPPKPITSNFKNIER